ncbi:site-specific integrase [Actinobaculum sp. 352]|uniref:tyrosine-type recombinase/integrase n=1 Tax=Actinobaculum sp. 352 TaxID=2490946 RepID=UPI000F7D8E15|nr:site-specific integrase [Actinobaculum sp. 352]RTE49172.1 site-specific integrase [Actinobaculum sp. 352]
MTRSTFGSVQTTRSGRYRGRYRKNGRDYYTPTQVTKSAVRADLTRVHASILNGTWTPPDGGTLTGPSPTLAAWRDTWISMLEASDYSPNTVRAYQSQWNAHIVPDLGPDTRLAQITTGMIREFLEALQGTVSPATVGNIARALSAGLSAAHTRGVLPTMPEFPPGWMRRVARRDGSKMIAYTAAELDRLIAAAPPRYKAALVLGSYGCLRAGEIAALRRDDITDGGCMVRVDQTTKRGPGGLITVGPPKSRAGYRTNALAPAQGRIVAEHLNQFVAPVPDALLWTAPLRDGHISTRALLNIYQQACENAGLPVGRFHDLRHSGLTLYGQAGATLAELMARAGHSDVNTVMIYQHAGAERDRILADRMTRG